MVVEVFEMEGTEEKKTEASAGVAKMLTFLSCFEVYKWINLITPGLIKIQNSKLLSLSEKI